MIFVAVREKMRGFLHCATHDETVRCFGRNDDFWWWVEEYGFASLDNPDDDFRVREECGSLRECPP